MRGIDCALSETRGNRCAQHRAHASQHCTRHVQLGHKQPRVIAVASHVIDSRVAGPSVQRCREARRQCPQVRMPSDVPAASCRSSSAASSAARSSCALSAVPGRPDAPDTTVPSLPAVARVVLVGWDFIFSSSCCSAAFRLCCSASIRACSSASCITFASSFASASSCNDHMVWWGARRRRGEGGGSALRISSMLNQSRRVT